MTEKVKFLCGNYRKVNLIYGIEYADYPWRYFDDKDTPASEHNILPDKFINLIATLDNPKTVEITLTVDQLKHYFTDGKFIFKNVELQTRLALINKNFGDQTVDRSSKRKITDQLVFISGQTNPQLFIVDFEKCTDVPTDKDKMFKIRNFVNDSHRVEFSELYFVSDWTTVRQHFVKKYSMSFTENKKNALNINFVDEWNVRLFFEKKLLSLSTYTTLPLVNQMEIILVELPCEIANLFIINDMVTAPKTKVLEFCDSIQDLASTMRDKPEKSPEMMPKGQKSMNEMEVFVYNQDLESSDQLSVASSSTVGRGSRQRGRGRIDSLSSDQNESDLTNYSSSSHNASKRKGDRDFENIVKTGRRPKALKTIEEQISTDDDD